MGVMVPRVKTRGQVEQIVAAVKYPPMGERGMMNARTNTDYRGMTIGEYGRWANAETMVVVQVETREAVEDIDAILAVPGWVPPTSPCRSARWTSRTRRWPSTSSG
jgi:4-hydroxy-2-oxoheptanedioate aldolase